jgi:multicomponent Na+:H+ antiporter subunit D
MSFLLCLNIILPLLAAASSLLKSRRLSQIITSVIGVLLITNNALLFANDNQEHLVLANFLGNYKLELISDSLSNIFALMVSVLYCSTNFYSFFYLQAQKHSNLGQDLNPRINFFFMPIAIMASLNIAYSANLISLFIFYEILTLSTYPLVIQSFSEHARKAGRFYLGILFGSSTFFLVIALIFLDHNYGGSSFKLGGIFNQDISIKDFIILLICFVFGFSKTAIFPLYAWLPRAMVAPIPVSALLHAVAVVKAGIFSLVKVFVYLFGIDYISNMHKSFPWSTDWLTLLACFSIVYAGIMACRQDSLKKILAYSTISQLSYMILALSIASYPALVAALLQMLAHSIAKITLFFSAGIIYLSLHKSDVSEMGGIFRILPIPVLLFIAASLSIIGLPFSLGYLVSSKFYQAIKCDTMVGSIAVSCLLLSSALSCYYFAKAIFQMLSPAREDNIIYYNTNKLSFITAITFLLSALLAFYLDDISNHLAQIQDLLES